MFITVTQRSSYTYIHISIHATMLPREGQICHLVFLCIILLQLILLVLLLLLLFVSSFVFLSLALSLSLNYFDFLSFLRGKNQNFSILNFSIPNIVLAYICILQRTSSRGIHPHPYSSQHFYFIYHIFFTYLENIAAHIDL